jgi:ribA/ribD-fused uncharacterized protein
VPDILFGGGLDDRWIAFSNFYTCAFCWRGHLWSHVEGAFQWAKNPEDRQHLQRCQMSPQEAKRAGRSCEIPKDWEKQRFDIMVSILVAKFSQNLHLLELLRSTGDSAIHEDRADVVWGGGPHYPHGADLLGKALMQVREMLCKGGTHASS